MRIKFPEKGGRYTVTDIGIFLVQNWWKRGEGNFVARERVNFNTPSRADEPKRVNFQLFLFSANISFSDPGSPPQACSRPWCPYGL